jgi:alpha-beta hydrolase superfamily lysophospholipase
MHQLIIKSKVNIVNESETIPLFLYGHSSGGVGAILYDQNRNALNLAPIDGIIATAPYFRLTKDLPEWQKGVLNLITKVDSSYTVTANFDVGQLTSDPKFQKKYSKDTLRYYDISAKQMKMWSDAGSFAMYDAAKCTSPILVIHGDQDAVSDYKSSECFVDICGSKQKKFVLAKGFMHDLHTESDREQVFIKIIIWLNHHIRTKLVRYSSLEALSVSDAGERRRSRVVTERPEVLNEIITKIEKMIISEQADAKAVEPAIEIQIAFE